MKASSIPIAILAALFAAAIPASAESPVETLVAAYVRSIQEVDLSAFDGLLADDFSAYVGGWGPSSCVTFDKQGFTDHIAGWQSTWATNNTLFRTKGKIQAGNTLALVLSIGYFSKPGMPGGAVNADEVLQFFWTNAAGTQITRFVELSGLVPAPNATAMLNAVWNPWVDGMNTRNASMIAGVLADDVQITAHYDDENAPAGYPPSPQSYSKAGYMAFLENDTFLHAQSLNLVPIEANAACTNYVWNYDTSFLLNNATQPSANMVEYHIAYMRLDEENQVVEAATWSLYGVPGPN